MHLHKQQQAYYIKYNHQQSLEYEYTLKEFSVSWSYKLVMTGT